MRMEQGVRTGFGHGGITCVLQTQFSSSFILHCRVLFVIISKSSRFSVLYCPVTPFLFLMHLYKVKEYML